MMKPVFLAGFFLYFLACVLLNTLIQLPISLMLLNITNLTEVTLN